MLTPYMRLLYILGIALVSASACTSEKTIHVHPGSDDLPSAIAQAAALASGRNGARVVVH